MTESTKSQKNNSDAGGALKFLGDRYSRVSEIGSGGMGKVYKAFDKTLDKWVAVKVLRSGVDGEAEAIRFQREAKAMSALQHQNLVTVLDFGVADDGKLYLVMDYFPGKTLGQILKQKGKLEVNTAIPIFKAIAEAMRHAHDNHVIHRDLKPDNVVVGDSQVKVIDFGIAKRILDADDGSLTSTGAVIGSPLYMSPEQVRGLEIDEKTDLYSLGCLIYTTLTGSPPFQGNTSMNTMQAHLSQLPEPMSLNTEASLEEELNALVLKLLKKDRQDRYQSMQEFLADLERLDVDAIGVAPGSELVGDYKSSFFRENRKFVILAAILLVGGITFISLPVLFRPKAKETPKESIINLEKIEESGNPPFFMKKGYWNIQPLASLDDSCVQWLVDKKPGNICLNGSRLTGKSLSLISDWNISEIEMEVSGLTDDGMSVLTDFKNLKKLVIGTTGITDRGLAHLKKAKNLVRLDIRNCKNVTGDGIKQIVRDCPGLTYFSCSNCSMSRDIVPELVKLRHIQHLHLAGLGLTDEDMEPLSRIDSLLNLDISENDQITEKGLMTLLKAPHLANLRVHECNFSPDAIAQFKKKRPHCSVDEKRKQGRYLREVKKFESFLK